MEKELKISLTEYEEMRDLIKEQDDAIRTFHEEKEEGVVVVNMAYGHNIMGFHVPRITGGKEAKEFLQAEFKSLQQEFSNLRASYARLLTEKKKEKKGWW